MFASFVVMALFFIDLVPSSSPFNHGICALADLSHAISDVVKIPRYTINCRAKTLKPKIFESVPISQQIREKTEKVFGYDFEIYDEDKGFNAKKVRFSGIKTQNKFILALHAAFVYHLPLQLRPDDIWIIIAQGIATHITKHSEELRNTFVDFEGKKEIIVRDDSLNINSQNNDWSFVLEQFEAAIRNQTNNDIANLMTCSFSTSSAVTKTASKCVLFKAVSEYFKFTTMTMSGIPKITLVGSVDDWKEIRTKCKKFREMNIKLDFWFDHLLPIIENIIDTVVLLSKDEKLSGELLGFWDSIYHYQTESGGDTVSGWVKSLFPYDIHRKENKELDWKLDGKRGWSQMGVSDFPGSYSRAPMTWKYIGTQIECGMYGGIVGIAQHDENGCIAPVIGWIIAGKQDVR